MSSLGIIFKDEMHINDQDANFIREENVTMEENGTVDNENALAKTSHTDDNVATSKKRVAPFVMVKK